MTLRFLTRTRVRLLPGGFRPSLFGVALLGVGVVVALTVVYTDGASATSHPAVSGAPATPDKCAQYAILAWNNLGMHCYNRDCADFLVLPPYNTLMAQVIRVADPPQIVTSGVTVDYSFPQNTYSAGQTPRRPDKTNFWRYAHALFSVNLAPNIGLCGKGLTGRMDPTDDYFKAEGIPLTEYRDIDVKPLQNPEQWRRYPYQLARLVARRAGSVIPLAENVIVAPVSSELSCNMCHMDDGDATTSHPITPTGKVETNILALHDFLSASNYPDPNVLLMNSRPVLCAKCHSSNALGMAGVTGISSLSNAMHNHHKDLEDITPDTDGCFRCHPGPQTQCLRCTMSQDFAFNCTTCHGTMQDVAQNPDPWLNEPRCDNASCHGSGYALDQPLYRMSRGHGGVYCCGCHDSPHAIAVSRETNDAIKFVTLQGHKGTLRDCTACHRTRPTSAFVHRRP